MSSDFGSLGDRGRLACRLLAAVTAAVLTWCAGVLPIRDHLRTRAADRLSHAR